MSASIKGRAVCWSIGGVTFTAGIVSGTNAEMVQSTRLSRASERSVIKDDAGTIRTMVYHGAMKTLSITVVPYHATTISGAVTSSDAHMPAPGTSVTIADASGTDTTMEAGTTAGVYNVVSATENRTVDGVRTIDLELEKGDEGVDTTTAAS